MILIDNYDSFTFNIVQYLLELGIEPKVFKNDKITIDELKSLDFESIILSPGPGNPCEKEWCGICTDVIKEFYTTKKILGICLGHQLIASFFGAKILKDPNPYHGKVSKIRILKDSKLFKEIPDGFEAARYHSLYAADLPAELLATAQTENGMLMAFEHKDFPLYGVQFHPEAILTQYGHRLLKNFDDIKTK